MTTFLSKLALRQRVRLDFDEPKHDSNGTVLAYVYGENKTFLNAKVVREGYARADENGSRALQLRRCEEEARRARKGLWAPDAEARDD